MAYVRLKVDPQEPPKTYQVLMPRNSLNFSMSATKAYGFVQECSLHHIAKSNTTTLVKW